MHCLLELSSGPVLFAPPMQSCCSHKPYTTPSIVTSFLISSEDGESWEGEGERGGGEVEGYEKNAL